MFTGLIEAVGEVVDAAPTDGGMRMRIESPFSSELALGESVAVNGVCLTTTAMGTGYFMADVGPETLRVTTLGGLDRGSLVNLERPLRADGRLGGHFVQGHIDAVGRIELWQMAAEFCRMVVSYPASLAPFLVIKGSIAVDGISLTVAELHSERFGVQLIPHTVTHTNLQRARVRDRVNLECDVIGKYVARAAELAGVVSLSQEK
jgi:riboflavin synthase